MTREEIEKQIALGEKLKAESIRKWDEKLEGLKAQLAALPKHEPRVGDILFNHGSWWMVDIGNIHLVSSNDTFTGLNIADFIEAWKKAEPDESCPRIKIALNVLADVCKAEAAR